MSLIFHAISSGFDGKSFVSSRNFRSCVESKNTWLIYSLTSIRILFINQKKS